MHGDCITITGKTVAESLAGIPAVPRSDQDVIRPIGKPMYAHGHLAILKGNLSPEGAVAKITGLKNPSITGPRNSMMRSVAPLTVRRRMTSRISVVVSHDGDFA